MRMRLGLVVGFGAGYYLGSKAGRERYEQLNDLIAKVRRSDAYDTATDKAKAVVELGVERARDVVEEHTSSDERPPEEHVGAPATRPIVGSNGAGPSLDVPIIPGGEG